MFSMLTLRNSSGKSPGNHRKRPHWLTFFNNLLGHLTSASEESVVEPHLLVTLRLIFRKSESGSVEIQIGRRCRPVYRIEGFKI
jgi:hypothetical protein